MKDPCTQQQQSGSCGLDCEVFCEGDCPIEDEIAEIEEKDDVKISKTDFALEITDFSKALDHPEFMNWFYLTELNNIGISYNVLWYKVYVKLGQTNVASEIAHKLLNHEGYTKKCKLKEKILTDPKLQITSKPIKKENKMSFNRPVKTKIIHYVNSHDVETMSNQNLFDNALALKKSIKILKQSKLKSSAINKEIKQQSKILKKVIKYLDNK